jgi:beta-glucosidase
MMRNVSRLALPLLPLVIPTGGLGARARALSRSGAPRGRRVADLLARDPRGKVAQLEGIWKRNEEDSTARRPLQPGRRHGECSVRASARSRGRVKSQNPPAGAPSVRAPRQHAEFVNAVQKWLIENTRLGIPALFHEEALHGLVAPGGTHFPVPLGLARAWDPALLERVMSVAAAEARARGVHHVLSPVVDLGRDPRWGRIEETYGEDPYLVSRLGVAAVRGYQGRSLPLAKNKVFATLKHFAGHGSHEGGINTAPALVPERLLRSELLVPFEAGVKEAGAFTVMPSYNEIDGVPSHVNQWLLEDVLRRSGDSRGWSRRTTSRSPAREPASRRARQG